MSALGAAAVFGVTKIGLDNLGKGANEHVWQAFAGLALFALGICTLIVTYLWLQGRTRTSMGDLLSTGRLSSGRKVRRRLEGKEDVERAPKYLYGGYDNVADFVDDFNEAQRLQSEDTSRRVTAVDYYRRIRNGLLATARDDRAAVVGQRATPLFVVGAVATVLGVSLYVWSINRDLTIRSDRLAAGANGQSGKLIPKSSSPILLRVPGGPAAEQVQVQVGKACDLKAIPAVALEIAAPPVAVGDPTRVVHVVTERTETCSVADIWASPAWVVARPDSGGPSTTAGATTTTAVPKGG